LALTAAAVATIPLGGHASTHSPEAVLVGSDLLHVVAAGAWLGGLVCLLAAFWPRRCDGVDDDGIEATARFSRLALVSIVALLAAGLVQSWIYLDGSPVEVLSWPYGVLLIIKLVLLAAIVLAGALNRRSLGRLVAGAGGAAAGLRRAMRVEVAIAVVVLAATAALVRSTPPASAGGPVNRELDLGGIRAELIIEPATTGPNDYHVYLFDRETGAQVRRVKGVVLRLEQPEEGIGPISLEMPYKSPAHYELLGPALGVTGDWDAALDVRVSRFDVFTARTEFEVRSP
jgi:copper transport protein